MTESVKGRTVADALALSERVRQMIAEPVDAPVGDLGELSALAGVRRFPVRAKCATLPWQALQAATAASPNVVSTE
jgi:nitrogen fixation NifU-like protein